MVQKKVLNSIAVSAVIFGTILLASGCGNNLKVSAYEKQSAESPIQQDIQLLKDMPQPTSMTIDPSLNPEEATAMVQTAQRFYAFWNTGNDDLVPQTVAPGFIDNTLPKGRPQGPEGLTFASHNFRTAVPDLQCKIEDLLVVGDKVTARLSFTGTHKGEFLGRAPTGKPIHFLAIDILHMKDGKIVEDWHLEDNLSLMQQLEVIPEN